MVKKMAKANISYKYRIYPTNEQEILLAKTFGCCRKIWNLMLADRKTHYQEFGKNLMVTPAKYKKEFPYLREVDSIALSYERLHLWTAYENFFRDKKIGFPKFKSKKDDTNSYTTRLVNNNIRISDNYIRLPKLKEIKCNIHRKPPENYILKSVTVSKNKDDTYYASILYEYEIDIHPVEYITTHIGLDYKSNGLYEDNFGNIADMPHYFRKSQSKLARAQKQLSHMIESHITGYKTVGNKRYPIYDRPLEECKNIKKQKRKVAKIHHHVSNQRKDFLHKLSSSLTDRYDLISVESLDMKAMANKGFGNGKATLDNGYGMFLNMLKYKQYLKGHYFIKIDKWFPSSQLCQCGYKNPITKNLLARTITCPVCGATYDRDKNAAINIDKEGLRLLLA